MTSFLPFSLQKALLNVGIEPQEVLFSLCSNSAPDGSLGESWYLFLDSTLSLILVTPLLGDLEVHSRFHVKDVRNIEARRTFLGNLHLSFLGRDDGQIAEFVVPGLQRDQWEPLLSMLELRFSDRLRQDEELCKHRLGDQVDPESGVPSIMSTAECFGGDLISMSGGKISIVGGPHLPGQDLSVNSPNDFKHQVSAAQMVSGPSAMNVIGQVGVDPIRISSDLPAGNLDQSYLPSSPAFDAPISFEIEDRSEGGTLQPPPEEPYALPSLDRRTAAPAPTQPPPSTGKKKKFKRDTAGKPADKSPGQDNEPDGIACPSCGRNNRTDYFFCLGCGIKLRDPEEEVSPTRRPAKSSSPAGKVAYGVSTESSEGDNLISGCLSQVFLVLVMMVGIFILLFVFG